MRAYYLDALRGMAVLWMIIFHAAYDLRLLGFVDWDFSQGFWYGFPRVIAFTFLFCVGVSTNYAHVPRVKWESLWKRSLKLAAAALIISLSTYFAFPSQWIFFGTLHCILIGSLLAAMLANRRRFSWIILSLILLAQYVLGFDIKWVASIIQKPSMDFIPIYPWLWAILFGMLTGPYLSKIKLLEQMPGSPLLNFLGRHSLKIYLLHQPLIYATLWGLKALLKGDFSLFS
jgi:uncharacterized membrane protein